MKDGAAVARSGPARRTKALTLAAGAIAALVFALGFIAIAEGYVEATTLGRDLQVFRVLTLAVSPLATRVMWIATVVGDTRTMVVETFVAACLLALWRRPRRAIVLVAAMGAGSASTNLLKLFYDRPRPPAMLALVAQPGSFSFPSGHATSSMLLFCVLGAMLLMSRRPLAIKVAGGVAAVCATLLVGASRVYLGVHWASDVVGSWFLAAALLAGAVTWLALWERTVPERAEAPLAGAARARRVAATVGLLALAVAAVIYGAAIDPLL